MSVYSSLLPSPAAHAGAARAAAAADDRVDFPAEGSRRADGWTPDRQAVFLRAIAQGVGVDAACRAVGLTKQSAYAFRRTANGAQFALAWQAAVLLARDTLADELMQRALHGVTDTYIRADGTTATRHRHDNHLAMKLLGRLDRMAESVGDASYTAARLVAADFDQFLDLLARAAGPARAGLFLGARLGAGALADDAAALEPVLALARADRWLRTHADSVLPVATEDLNVDARAEWSAEQWARAEAAGLVALAPAATPQSSQDSQDWEAAEADEDEDLEDEDEDEWGVPADDAPVWFDEFTDGWRTRFPPPPDFAGEEDGDYGEEGYSRELSDAETAIIEAQRTAERAPALAAAAADRDRWFADAAAATAALVAGGPELTGGPPVAG